MLEVVNQYLQNRIFNFSSFIHAMPNSILPLATSSATIKMRARTMDKDRILTHSSMLNRNAFLSITLKYVVISRLNKSAFLSFYHTTEQNSLNADHVSSQMLSTVLVINSPQADDHSTQHPLIGDE